MTDFANLRRLPRKDVIHLTSAAKKVERIDAFCKRRIARAIRDRNDEMIRAITDGMSLEYVDVDFYSVIARNTYDVYRAAIVEASTYLKVNVTQAKLAKGRSRIPRSLKELREWWDKIQSGEIIPRRITSMADKIKKEYLERVQSIWRQYSDDFRSGRKWNQDEVKAEVQKQAEVTTSRAKMITQTETTRHYNRVRKEYYSQSPDVEYFMFLSIRDHRTTKWCKCRSGLVYAVGSQYLKDETPACHWNCRSEIVPLIRFNPVHKAIIADEKRRRENNVCEPLPKGWIAA